MKFFDLRSVFAVAALALLTACGGAPDQGDTGTTTAAVMTYSNAPVADCDAEGTCNGPRIIDGMAEQYRAGAIALQQAEQQQQQDQQQGILPVQAAEQLPAALPVQAVETAIEAAPAAAVQAQ